jgi:uncharacterized ion transporter superfamily protein YfcC
MKVLKPTGGILLATLGVAYSHNLWLNFSGSTPTLILLTGCYRFSRK